MKFSKMTSFEKMMYIERCNFTKEESCVFILLSNGTSIKETSFKLNMSEATINRRIATIKEKMQRVDEENDGVLR